MTTTATPQHNNLALGVMKFTIYNNFVWSVLRSRKEDV